MSFRDRTPADEVAVVLVWLGMAAWCAAVFLGGGSWIERTFQASQISGYTALGFLGTSLLAGPILRGLTWIGLQVSPSASFRFSRNCGIAAGFSALLHGGIVLTTYFEHDWWDALGWPYLYSGVLALMLFVVLLIGSIKPLMTAIGWQLWKPFFRLSFVIAALTLHHMLYAPLSSTVWTLGLYGGAIMLSLLRFLPARQTAEEP